MTKAPEVTAFLGLGSNLGDRLQLLKDAVNRLHNQAGIEVTDVSDVYETDPVGYTDQPSFLNIVCRVRTSLTPQELLEVSLGIERELGRERKIRWGPRTIDIDVLLYDDRIIETPALTIPHPRIMERAFVLIPLFDVLSEQEKIWQPGFTQAANLSMEGILATGVRRWISFNWQGEFGPTES